MRDKLDGLSDLLIKLSRIPGCGFLEDHATSLTRMKHTVEGHISDIEAKKQGVEEAGDLAKGAVRSRNKPHGGQPSEYGPLKSGGADPGEVPAGGESTKLRSERATVKSAKQVKPASEIRTQKKLLQQKLKR